MGVEREKRGISGGCHLRQVLEGVLTELYLGQISDWGLENVTLWASIELSRPAGQAREIGI